MKRFRLFDQQRPLSAGLVALAGCTVGPNYKRPAYPQPPAFRGADGAVVATDAKTSLGDEQWAAVYREPELQDLIRKALANNYDVRIAAQRILEQQAQVRIARSQQFPAMTVGGTGIGATLPSSLGTNIPSPLVEGSLQPVRVVDARFLGPLSAPDRIRPRAAARASLGAARRAPYARRSSGDRLSANPRTRQPA